MIATLVPGRSLASAADPSPRFRPVLLLHANQIPAGAFRFAVNGLDLAYDLRRPLSLDPRQLRGSGSPIYTGLVLISRSTYTY
jgi:hypothetical protein